MKSPCRNLCTADHPSGICQGCGRTVIEVCEWASYSDTKKLKILERIIMSDDFKRTTHITLESKMNRVDYEADQDEIYLRDAGGTSMLIERQAINTLLIMLAEARDAD